jgi:hypothetical protein
MIKVEYNVTFPKDVKWEDLTQDLEIVESIKIQEILRKEAIERGCTFFKDTNLEENTHTLYFVWTNDEECKKFVEWAEASYNYTALYSSFVKKIEAYGGKFIRDEVVFKED